MRFSFRDSAATSRAGSSALPLNNVNTVAMSCPPTPALPFFRADNTCSIEQVVEQPNSGGAADDVEHHEQQRVHQTDGAAGGSGSKRPTRQLPAAAREDISEMREQAGDESLVQCGD